MLQLRLQKLLAQYRCLCRAALGDNLGFSSQDEVTPGDGWIAVLCPFPAQGVSASGFGGCVGRVSL